MPYDSVLLYLVNWLTRCLPPTRCYRMKVRLYRLCGFDIADSCRSLILEQVTNGLAVRMAALFLVNGGKGPQELAGG